MNIPASTRSIVLLAAISLVVSRGTLALFDDPEGPNVLVVVLGAVALFVPSMIFVLSSRIALTGYKKLAAAVVLQIVLAAGLYLVLR